MWPLYFVVTTVSWDVQMFDWCTYKKTRCNSRCNLSLCSALHLMLDIDNYMPKAYLAVANWNWSGWNFTGRRQFGWHALLQTFRTFHQRGAKQCQRNCILQTFLSAKQRIPVSLTSQRPISMKFEHKTWISVVMNSFRAELQNFSRKGSFTPKTSF